MNLPDHIDLGPHRISVHSDPSAVQRLYDESNKGHSVTETNTILVDATHLHRSQAAETLVHEALHHCWEQSGLRGIEEIHEHTEPIITALAPRILELLRRNPDLVRYLVKAT